MLSQEQFERTKWPDRMDHYAKHIALNGLNRPWIVYVPHAINFIVTYTSFLLLTYFLPRPSGISTADYGMLIFVKLLVWMRLAEAFGCRQGPLFGHLGLPNNWKFRLSTGTMKYSPFPQLFGAKRNVIDLVVHIMFFACCFAFAFSTEYNVVYIRCLCACDFWLLWSDQGQFTASNGHTYFTMILSACVPSGSGRLCGMQLALIMQWFFSGIGKIGPWFSYVNGPFILQSKWCKGRRWLFDLLIKSPEDLSPTTFGLVLAHAAAAVEYLAPLAFMVPIHGFIWFGLVGIVAMHIYILIMPAPFDVYVWNFCFMLSAIFLFYYASFGLDHNGLATLDPYLAAVLIIEFVVCWCGEFFTEHIGYYLSHRYWAGNWVMCFHLIKNTDAVRSGSKHRQTSVSNIKDLNKLSMHFLRLVLRLSLSFIFARNTFHHVPFAQLSPEN